MERTKMKKTFALSLIVATLTGCGTVNNALVEKLKL